MSTPQWKKIYKESNHALIFKKRKKENYETSVETSYLILYTVVKYAWKRYFDVHEIVFILSEV